MKLGTKAETLHIIEHSLKSAKVLPQYLFTVGQWKNNITELLTAFRGLPWNENVIVRSSSMQEDTDNHSKAGKYESISNVQGEIQLAEE